MNILILNGPNLNLLGTRDTDIYGTGTIDELERFIANSFPDYSFSFYQSNVEGELINRIQQAMQDGTDAIVANFGGYTHTSVAIRDALDSVKIPKIEVHISNIHGREEFREKSITGKVTNGIITGFGKYSYILGVQAAEHILKSIK